MRAPRSLADALRQRDDDALARLLTRRPDLIHPVPADFTALTARATAGPAVARCLDTLDAMHLHVLRTAAEVTAEEPAAAEAILTTALRDLPAEAGGAARDALADLVDLALIWGTSSGLRAIIPVRELVGTPPLPDWPPPATVTGHPHDVHDVDAQAALHAREALALVRDLIDDWSVHPPGVLRSGGLSLRDFAATRARLHSDWAHASLTIELAHAARLVADDEEEVPHWLPTDVVDTWVSRTPAEQWLDLVEAWLDLPRLPSLATEKTQVLSAERDRRAIPVMRRDVLDLLATLPTGTSLREDQIIAVLDDRQPRRAGELRVLTVRATLREGTDLGVIGAGAVSTPARLLLSSPASTPTEKRARAQQVAALLDEALPVDVDHVLIQADLTVVAPGPLAPSIARTLRLIADVESRGHATVYRVTEASVRRGLDAGWDAESIHAFLADVSRTPVPQPLTYLVDDVARRHGAVRVGSALAYLRSDNADALAAVCADKRLKALGLHRIAETVVICHAPASEVISALRNAGYAPAAESPDGVVLIRRPEDRRTAAPKTTGVTVRRRSAGASVEAVVRALRAGDTAGGRVGAAVSGPAATTAELPRLSAAAIVSALKGALAENRPLWIGYADTDGAVVQQVVDPIRLHAGVLTAFDHRTDTVRQFSVSRITGIADVGTG